MKYKQAIQTLLCMTSLMLMLLFSAYSVAKTNDSTQQLNALIEALEAKRLEHHIPGMAVAVIKENQVILAKGFGMMNLNEQRPVTTETLFSIGSSTKAFTAMLTAMMIDQKRMTWEDQVSQYLPEYQFTVDDEKLPITLRDLLSHRTGYTRNDLLWANGTANRDLILKTATNAQPWDGFRENFHYNNVMYLAAGEATALAAKTSWDELLSQLILQPLAMNNTTSDHEAALKNNNLSLGYQWNEETGSHDLMPRRNLNNVAPAGGIYSNITDMAQWVKLLLNQGQWQEKQLISAQQLQATWKPAIKVSEGVDYGLGWFIRKWQGQRLIEHGGNIDGYGAQVALLPESNLGFVLLTNVTATPLQQESINLIWDHLAAPEKNSLAAGQPDSSKVDYQEFVGEYLANFASFKDSVFTFKVKENGIPAVDVPGQTLYELKDPDADGKWYFAMTDTIAISFDRTVDGQIAAMRMHQNRLDFELPRKGVEITPEIDASELQIYLGQYQSKVFNGPINAIIQNHRLTLDVPNQMAFELELPDANGFRQFRIKSDMSAQFETDNNGTISNLVLYKDKEKVVDTAPKNNSAQQVTLPSIDEIMKLRKTKIRKKALKRKSGFKLTGTIDMVNAGIAGTINTHFDANENYRQHMDFGIFGEILVAINKNTAATTGINPYTEFKGKYLKQIKMDHPAVAIDWRDHAERLEVIGVNEIDGQPVYIVKMKVKELPTTTLYISTINGDVLRQKSKVMNPTVGSININIDYSDYREHHGLRLPMKTTIKNPMMGIAKIIYTDIKANQKFKPSEFILTKP